MGMLNYLTPLLNTALVKRIKSSIHTLKYRDLIQRDYYLG